MQELHRQLSCVLVETAMIQRSAYTRFFKVGVQAFGAFSVVHKNDCFPFRHRTEKSHKGLRLVNSRTSHMDFLQGATAAVCAVVVGLPLSVGQIIGYSLRNSGRCEDNGFQSAHFFDDASHVCVKTEFDTFIVFVKHKYFCFGQVQSSAVNMVQQTPRGSHYYVWNRGQRFFFIVHFVTAINRCDFISCRGSLDNRGYL